MRVRGWAARILRAEPIKARLSDVGACERTNDWVREQVITVGISRQYAGGPPRLELEMSPAEVRDLIGHLQTALSNTVRL